MPPSAPVPPDGMPVRPPVAMQSDALFRAAADQAPQVMWIVNRKGAVTYLNRAWYELVGGEPPKWYGHEWGDTVVPEDLADMRARWRESSANGTIFQGMRRVRAQDGTQHILSYKATPVRDEGGNITCWVGMDADITQLVATEAALRFANRELEAFCYSVSHDLRTPMVTVQGFVGLLIKRLGDADAKTRHYLDRISVSIHHMGRLVDGLLALGHVARARLRWDTVDLSQLASQVVDMHRKREPDRAATVHVQQGMVAHGDERLLAVLMENLIGNAWKFTVQKQPATIAVEMPPVATPQERVFVVRDNGVGFDMMHAGQLFGPFQRLHTTDEFPGTGIGLATVHRIITRHGGRVWAESEPGRGTSIFFSLPEP